MFKLLKEKLKNWINKSKNEEEINIEPKEETIKEKKSIIPDRKKQINEKQVLGEEVKEPKKQFQLFKKIITEEKFEEKFEELELILLQNNVALEAVEKIKSELKTEIVGKDISTVNMQEKLKKSIEDILINPKDIIKEIKETLNVKKPFVILFVGINGVGKTTTMAKFANFLKKNKISCCLAAADTYRAASIEQLQEHSEKLEIPIIKKDYGSDPASVGFDAIQYAKKHRIEVVLIDTAGRMHTKDSLMKEIEKISKVTNSDMKIFIGESTTGNDSIEQAKAFNTALNLTGIILSKADVDEKGGTAISVGYITKKPILFLGTGQTYPDLEVFDKKKIIRSLGL